MAVDYAADLKGEIPESAEREEGDYGSRVVDIVDVGFWVLKPLIYLYARRNICCLRQRNFIDSLAPLEASL